MGDTAIVKMLLADGRADVNLQEYVVRLLFIFKFKMYHKFYFFFVSVVWIHGPNVSICGRSH